MRSKRVAIYTRVSTAEQNTDAQETELKEYAAARGWSVHRVFTDEGVSGAKVSRPALDELMTACRRRKIDIVLVWRFDRFARSVSHLLTALETFRGLGIEFVSFSEQIDTSTAAGKMVFTVLGAVAELERSLIGERVKSGLAQARRSGKRLGRPPLRELSREEIVRVRKDRATGRFTLRQLARRHRASLWCVFQATRKQNVRI